VDVSAGLVKVQRQVLLLNKQESLLDKKVLVVEINTLQMWLSVHSLSFQPKIFLRTLDLVE